MGIILAKTQRDVLFSRSSNAVVNAEFIFPHFVSCSWVREEALTINESYGLHISLNITFVGSYWV